ncbi:hypothetical protein [Streptomyces sp. NPDC051286]
MRCFGWRGDSSGTSRQAVLVRNYWVLARAARNLKAASAALTLS